MDEQMREKLLPLIDAYGEACAEAGYICAHDKEWTAVDKAKADLIAALSQPAAAQGDSSHFAGGECGGVQVRTVLLDVEAERQRQDIKWGGPAHDDSHEIADFVQLIEDYAGWARTMAGMGSYDKARNRLIQVAALASACCESIDRSTPKATP